jgi:anthranilate phosphoribosyltransferase
VEGPDVAEAEAEAMSENGERCSDVVGAGSDGGSKEVRIVPMDAMIVSLCQVSVASS